MCFDAFSEYLSQGGLFICETRDEFTALVAESKARAVFHYACPETHISKISVAGFRNKKRIRGNNFENFCAQCQALVNKHEISSVRESIPQVSTRVCETAAQNTQGLDGYDISLQAPDKVFNNRNQKNNVRTGGQDIVQTVSEDSDAPADVHSDPESCGTSVRSGPEEASYHSQTKDCNSDVQGEYVASDGEDHRRCDDVTGGAPSCVHRPEGETGSQEVDAPNRNVYEAILKRYGKTQPEFFECYSNRRPTLYAKYSEISSLMFNERNNYTDMAVAWLLETRNVIARRYLVSSEISVGSEIRVDVIGLTVYVQTATVYNMDPKLFYNKYKSMCHPVFVLFFNNDEHVDTWYFIPGKKVYSVRYKHTFDPYSQIDAYETSDDIEYYYFEKSMFELEIAIASEIL